MSALTTARHTVTSGEYLVLHQDNSDGSVIPTDVVSRGVTTFVQASLRAKWRDLGWDPVPEIPRLHSRARSARADEVVLIINMMLY